MHSVGHWLNAVVTFAGLLLAVISVLASVSDSFNSPSVVASAQVVKVNRFRKQLSGNDEVRQKKVRVKKLRSDAKQEEQKLQKLAH